MREELRRRLREIIREYEEKYGSFEKLERKVQRGASLEELDDYSGWKAARELLRKVGGDKDEKK